jgi:hypothetical protein
MHDLLIRLALGSPCLGIAVWMMLQPSANLWINMLGVFPCLTAFGLIVTPSSTTVAASVFREFFMPDREAQEKPGTRRAEVHRFHNRYGKALFEYEMLLERFPDDLKLWNAAFELSWVHLRDPETAEQLLQRAITRSINPERAAKIEHLAAVQRRRYEDMQDALALSS